MGCSDSLGLQVTTDSICVTPCVVQVTQRGNFEHFLWRCNLFLVFVTGIGPISGLSVLRIGKNLIIDLLLPLKCVILSGFLSNLHM